MVVPYGKGDRVAGTWWLFVVMEWDSKLKSFYSMSLQQPSRGRAVGKDMF